MVDETLKQEHIRCRIIIEVLGKPKEYVETTIREYVEKIKKDDDLIILNEEYSKAAEQDKLWAIFVELELVVKGVHKLVGFCFEYMPSTIEIIKPDELRLKNRQMASFLNDLQGRLHNVDMIVKQLKNQNDFLRKNMNSIIQNTILISLRTMKLDIDKLSKVTGIKKDELDKYVEKMEKDNKIKKEGEILSLA